jgi:hypothetical protein
MVDVNQLASDYQRWQKEKKEFRRLRDLHHIQERLREKQTHDLTMTDINEANKQQKKNIKSMATPNETTSIK